jgi:hypothetical protein
LELEFDDVLPANATGVSANVVKIDATSRRFMANPPFSGQRAGPPRVSSIECRDRSSHPCYAPSGTGMLASGVVVPILPRQGDVTRPRLDGTILDVTMKTAGDL